MPRARVEKLELEYETFGRASDPALLLIMGLGGQLVLWDEGFCERLVAHGFFVIRFDNRDVGLSTKLDSAGMSNVIGALLNVARGRPVQAPYTLEEMAEDALGLLDALRISAAHVVGSSMGGATAQILTIAHPARVLSLTSIMSTSGDPSVPAAPLELVGRLSERPPEEREAFLEYSVRVQRAAAGQGGYFDEARALERAARVFERGVDVGGPARQFVAMLAAPSRRAGLTGVRAPTLVVHGETDPLAHPLGGRDTAAAVPDAELLEVPEMGHDLPPPVWGLVADAIAKNAKRSAAELPVGVPGPV